MQDKEIIQKWKQGLSKNQLATMYKRQYNQEIKVIRSTVRHRHDGRYISNYEALAYVERVIYKYLKGQTNENTENNHEYILVKEYKNFIMYEDMITHSKECFNRQELGLVKEQIKAPKLKLNPEKVKI